VRMLDLIFGLYGSLWALLGAYFSFAAGIASWLSSWLVLSCVNHPIMAICAACVGVRLRLEWTNTPLENGWRLLLRDAWAIFTLPVTILNWVSMGVLLAWWDRSRVKAWFVNRWDDTKRFGVRVVAGGWLRSTWNWASNNMEWIVACTIAVGIIGSFFQEQWRAKVRRQRRLRPEAARLSRQALEFVDYTLSCLHWTALLVGLTAFGWDGAKRSGFEGLIKDLWRKSMGAGAPRKHPEDEKDERAAEKRKKHLSDRLAFIREQQEANTRKLSRYEGANLADLSGDQRNERELCLGLEKHYQNEVNRITAEEDDLTDDFDDVDRHFGSNRFSEAMTTGEKIRNAFVRYGIAFVCVGIISAFVCGLIYFLMRLDTWGSEVEESAPVKSGMDRAKNLITTSVDADLQDVGVTWQLRVPREGKKKPAVYVLQTTPPGKADGLRQVSRGWKDPFWVGDEIVVSGENPEFKIVYEARRYHNPSPNDFTLDDQADRDEWKKITDANAQKMIDRIFESKKELEQQLETAVKLSAEQKDQLRQELSDSMQEILRKYYEQKDKMGTLERVNQKLLDHTTQVQSKVDRLAADVERMNAERSAKTAVPVQIVPQVEPVVEARVERCKSCNVALSNTQSAYCAGCRAKRKNKKNQERKDKKKQETESPKEPKQEAIMVNSSLLKPVNHRAVVKIVGFKKSDGPTASTSWAKNGVVVKGNLVTCDHGPNTRMEVYSRENGRHGVREETYVKPHEADICLYAAPKGNYGPADKGDVKVRRAKVGEKCYVMYYNREDELWTLGPEGMVQDVGNIEKHTAGLHTASTVEGASGCPLFAISDNALIGIHVAAQKGSPNRFVPIDHDKVGVTADGKVMPWPKRQGN